MPDGSEWPIKFASRALSKAAINYANIERETLAVVFGVKKFHDFLFGRHFILANNHKPLLSLFNESKSVSNMASPRIQRWALTLSMYEYSFKYTPGRTIGHADVFSRLPVGDAPKGMPPPLEVVFSLNLME